MQTIRCELGVAVSTSEGDRGTWSTDYIWIPADTPEEKIEAVAIERYKRENATKLIEIQHLWLYSWEYSED